jgi:hypothetical protein
VGHTSIFQAQPAILLLPVPPQQFKLCPHILGVLNVSLTTLNLIASLVERTRFVETFRRNKKNVQVKFFDWRSDVEQPIPGKD